MEIAPGQNFMLVAFQVEDWNRDFSPWEAPAMFGTERFSGQGAETLRWLTEECMPYIDQTFDTERRERWLMGYFKQPKDFEQVDKVVDMYEKLGVDRLAAWTYRGGYGTVLAAPDALKLWDKIGENYKRVLKK